MNATLSRSLALAALLTSASPRTLAAECHCHDKTSAVQLAPTQATRTVRQAPALPAVTLLDQDGRAAPLREILRPGPALVVNFVFTTCTTICPVMSATFAGLQQRLGDGARDLRMISISIDPENDRPAQLAAYAKRYKAGPQWSFYTGTLGDVRAVLQAFDVLTPDKTSHRAVTWIRQAGRSDWIRLDGLVNAERIAGELATRQAAR